jgi:hypothetical protein
MKSHAAFPDSDHFFQVLDIESGIIKQHIAQTPAKDDANGDIDQQIAADKTGILGKNLGEVKSLLTAQKATAAVPATRFRVTDGQVQHGTPAVPAVPFEPVTDIENLNRARKFLRDKMKLPDFSAEAIPKEVGARLDVSLGNLAQKMEDASVNFTQGNKIYQTMSDKFVEPLKRQPIGLLAGTDDVAAQRGILFGKSPDAGTDKFAGSAVTHLNAKDPTAARDMLRLFLKSKFDETGQNIQTGANELSRSIGAALNASATFDQCMFQAGYRKQ